MSEAKQTTSVVNGKLWGAAAEDWAAIQEGTCRPVYEAVFAKTGVAVGMTYLDAGCGAGMATQIAAALGARVFGLDAAEPLLEIARRRVPAGKYWQGELQELPFDNGTFDLVTGFNSFQYAADPKGALREARRVAAPGATVVIMTWGCPEGMQAASLLAALRPLMPLPPPGAPGPFALSDETALRAFAEGAGLVPVEVIDVDSPWVYADLATALRGLGSSGVAARAAANTSREAVDEAHAEALAPFLQEDGSYRVGATFRCLITKT